MKKPILLALLVLATLQVWETFKPSASAPQPLLETPYVVVYGRNSCNITQNMLRTLKNNSINYHYYVVDKPDIAQSLHSRMQTAGLDTSHYNLPVVDVSGKIMIRPAADRVMALRRSQKY